MAKAKIEERIEAPAEKVWALANWKDFVDLVDMPATVTYSGEGVGAIRTVLTDDGDTLVERLVELNGGNDYSYTVDEYGPAPFREYLAKISVMPDGDDACLLTIQAEFTPHGETEKNCVDMWLGIFQAPIAAIKEAVRA